MHRLRLATLAAATLLASPAAAQNVLVVVADDLGTDKLSMYTPSATIPTPTLDALAADGVRFDNAWACPVCSPTRATLQTGRYPFRHGVVNAIPFGPPLPREEVTLARVFDLAAEDGQADIATAAIGKWHLGALGDATDPLCRGYDVWDGANIGALFSYEFWPRTVQTETFISTEYATSEQVDAASAFINGAEGPWFCYLSFHAPHTPFHAPPQELHSQDLPDVDPTEEPVPFFAAMTEAVDTELGRLLAEIPADVLAETTIIVVGDNGTTGDAVEPPFEPTRSKGSFYQNGVRVPLIVSGAQVAAPGRDVNALVDVSDLFATVLELSGIDWEPLMPPQTPIDSVSLLPYIEQPFALPQRDWVFAQTTLPFIPPGPLLGLILPQTDLIAGAQVTSGVTLRNQTFKWIRYDDGDEELFNLALDPNEGINLLNLPFLSPQAQAAYDELSGVLASLLDA